jgi:hypothetical protein
MKTLQTITTVTTSGQEVKFQLFEYSHGEKIGVAVWAGGKKVAEGTPEALDELKDGKRVYGRIGKVYMTNPDKWNEVWTAYVAAKEDLEACEEYRVRRLRSLRDRLAREVGYALDEEHEMHQRGVERAMQGSPYRVNDDALAQKVADARKALAEFDAAHPEIIAAIRKEKEEELERNRWN